MNSRNYENSLHGVILKSIRHCDWEGAFQAYEKCNQCREFINDFICECLIREGRLDCLQWLQDHKFSIPNRLIRGGVQRGYCPSVEWLRLTGPEIWFDVFTGDAPKKCWKWIRRAGISFPEGLFEHVSVSGRLDAMKWLRKEGCSRGIVTVSSTAYTGHLSCVKWLLEVGIPPDPETVFQDGIVLNKNCHLWLLSRGIM